MIVLFIVLATDLLYFSLFLSLSIFAFVSLYFYLFSSQNPLCFDLKKQLFLLCPSNNKIAFQFWADQTKPRQQVRLPSASSRCCKCTMYLPIGTGMETMYLHSLWYYISSKRRIIPRIQLPLIIKFLIGTLQLHQLTQV